jgi:hypothetical protein
MDVRRFVIILLFGPVLLALTPASAREGPDNPAATIAAIESPRISGEINPPVTIAVGRAEVHPGAGARVFVMSASGRPCGLLVDGTASLLYHVQDRFSQALARRNGRRADGVVVNEVSGEVTLAASLRGAAIWGWNRETESTPSRPVTGVTLPAWLQQIISRKADSNPGHDMLLSDANADPGYQWAVFHTTGDDVVLDVDPRASVRVEALGYYRRLARDQGPYAGLLVPEPLVEQPIGRRWWDSVSVDFASTDTDIKIKNDTRAHVTITTRSKMLILQDHMAVMPLRLRSEWVTQDGNQRPLNITSLTVDGVAAPFAQEHESLLVALPHPLAKGDTPTLVVAAEGNILDFPAGDTYWVLGTSSWYPRPGGGGIEWAAFHLSLSSPPPMVPFVAGEISQPPSPANGNTVVASLKAPMEYAIAMAGKYSTFAEERDGARVDVSTYASAKKEEAHRLAGIVYGIRGCLEEALGVPYPFQDLHLIEMNEWGWGQAPPGVIFITKEALLSRALAGTLDGQARSMAEIVSPSVNARIAHEVAHGWFPHVAKIDRHEESWLSESFAEYMSTVCLERSADVGRGKYLYDSELSRWKMMSGAVGDLGSIYFAEHLGSREGDGRDRYYLLYGKGPIVLHALRLQLRRDSGDDKEGDRIFFTWLRSYVKNFTYKRGGTRHLVAILNQITSKDWQPWFERYVYGTETPKLN